MSTENTGTQTNQPSVVRLGAPQRINSLQRDAGAAEKAVESGGVVKEINENNQNGTGSDSSNNGSQTDGAPVGDSKGNNETLITDESVKAYLKEKGIPFESFDDLKEKLKQKVEKKETAEEKQAKEQAGEKRMLDLFMSGGGTIEQYASLKDLSKADLKDLSRDEVRRELKDAKFSDEEIEQIIKQQYFQTSDEELEQLEDESDKEFETRKREYGSKFFENRATHIKTQAEQIFNSLKERIEAEDLQAQQEVEFSSKIDEHFQKLPRKVTFELGEENSRKLTPIEYDVAEADIADVLSTLKDPAKRNNFLFNNEGQLNLENIADLLVRNKFLESAVKTSYLTGETRMTEELERTFGSRSASGVGLGGSNYGKQSQNGAAVSRGQSQRVVPQRN